MIFSLSYTKKNMSFTLSQKSETDFMSERKKGKRQKGLLYTAHHFIKTFCHQYATLWQLQTDKAVAFSLLAQKSLISQNALFS